MVHATRLNAPFSGPKSGRPTRRPRPQTSGGGTPPVWVPPAVGPESDPSTRPSAAGGGGWGDAPRLMAPPPTISPPPPSAPPLIPRPPPLCRFKSLGVSADTSRTVQDTSLQTQKFGDRFQVRAESGTGGMGTVYRATDLLTGQDVALKVLHGKQGACRTERFNQEAALLADLAHPAIVRYVDHGVTPGRRALPGDGVARGRDAGSTAWPAARSASLDGHAPGPPRARGARRRAPQGDRPPRPQAGQPLPARARSGARSSCSTSASPAACSTPGASP